jgi:COP9 signalosome complex subunit 5
MALHCRSGSNLEVMGMLQGKTIGDAFIVLDTFPLPVEGTETRVNAQAEAYEYMVDFVQASLLAGRREYVIGW